MRIDLRFLIVGLPVVAGSRWEDRRDGIAIRIDDSAESLGRCREPGPVGRLELDESCAVGHETVGELEDAFCEIREGLVDGLQVGLVLDGGRAAHVADAGEDGVELVFEGVEGILEVRD